MPSIESININLEEALEKLDSAVVKTLQLSKLRKDSPISIGKLGRAIGLVREFQETIYEIKPSLRAKSEISLDPALTPQQNEECSKLSEIELESIDKLILSKVTSNYSKVAMIVGQVLLEDHWFLAGIPDVFISERVRKLVDDGKLQAIGNLYAMRYSEVRIDD